MELMNVSAAAKLFPDTQAALEFAGKIIIHSRREPKLKQCSVSSIVGAFLSSYHSGLDIFTLPPQGYILPYKNKDTGGFEAQFQADYRGLLKLIYETEKVFKVQPEMVLREDELTFKVRDSKQVVDWTPKQADKSDYKGYQGVLLGVWYILPNGGTQCVYEFVPAEEINKVRAVAKTDKIWIKWFRDMAFKTAIRKVAKTLQIHVSPKLAKAIQIDTLNDVGLIDYDKETGEIVEKDQATDEVKADDKEKKANIAKAKAALKQAETAEYEDTTIEDEAPEAKDEPTEEGKRINENSI